MRKLVSIVLVLTFLNGLSAGTSEATDFYPQRIILNLTSEPESSIAVTWRTEKTLDSAVVQFAEATDWIDFKENVIEVNANRTRFITGELDTVFHYSAVLSELKASTQYVYRVGVNKFWSEWFQFTTAGKYPEPFKLIYFGDPQNDIKEHCSRVFRQAYKTAPDASFWLFAGDIVTWPKDSLYGEFFHAGSFIFANTPLILTPGNHDRVLMENGKPARDEQGKVIVMDKVDELWNHHFTLPENGLVGFEETSFFVDYQGVRIIMIQTNDENRLTGQAKWIESLLKDNPNRWTVVSFHHPVYSATSGRDDDKSRIALQPLFDKYSVDLVLTGHDHVYSRSFKLVGNQKVSWDKPGTVYVVSVSGTRMYPVKTDEISIMAKTGGNVQLFQVLTVSQHSLRYESYTATGKLYDHFELKKK
ncbi:fibronectin type III domain-containing protein [Candidatus Neomarinimicrobiota bacterium]